MPVTVKALQDGPLQVKGEMRSPGRPGKRHRHQARRHLSVPVRQLGEQALLRRCSQEVAFKS